MNKYYSDADWDYVEMQIAGISILPLDTGPFREVVHPGFVALKLEELIHKGYEIVKLPKTGLTEMADVKVDGDNWWIKLRKRK